MNFFDINIIRFFNQFSKHSGTFDQIIFLIANNNLLKGGVFISIIWWAWFKGDDRHSNNREKLIIALFSGILAIAAGRALALLLPYRLRPIHNDSLNFVIPYGITPALLKGWSSFPSDHAALFFALSTSLFFISRKVGTFVTIYTIFFVALPRIYLGFHYPTDIVAGALIGIIITLIVNFYFIKNRITGLIVDWSYAKPDFFYPLFFLLTYQIAELFNSTRTLLSFGSRLVQKIILTFF